MNIPIWKWEDVNMDFITGLSFSFKRYDSIWVIIDRLTKSAHFLPVKSRSIAEEYAKIYVREGVHLHGTLLSIISVWGAQFMAYFWRSFQRSLGLQSQEKSYAIGRRSDIEFQVDDWVFLEVSPMKGVMRFGRKGKLIPRYIGPYKVIRRVGQVSYKVDLPRELAAVHSIFHVSMLHKCLGDPTQVIPIYGMEFSKHLSYKEILVEILDRHVRKLRTKDIASVKVLWRSQNIEEDRWEVEANMRAKYPHLFQ
ncbi:hypothetical protein MTR67_034624 [Solanum verrucosum]|uniref:Tf2-1-like SH3-like domain-containing protein n=1 Tax=Solanum verrucosum TaxID=315347 RepID=A0AAF0ZLH3_SOLVR|nr:hypothetical protein MTR67_034624 [Solanum verrucosum]